MPNIDVYSAMRLSYDDLDRKEQKIFLDLACFIIGLNLDLEHIKYLLKDSDSDNSVAAGLERLKDKALITISKDSVVSMHDIIQEMAWKIARHESIEEPGSRSRLRDPDDIYEVLKYNKGTEAIRSIRANMSEIRKLKLSPDIFSKMSKLQFLYFSSKDDFDLLPGGLQSFPVDLRYLAWKHYPLNSLPENFSAENLVILDLSYSKVEKLWDGVKNLMNLKGVSVSGSKNLKELPDLSKATNLEVLYINSCPMLTSLSPSIFSLNKLEELELRSCSLTKIISDNHLSSLNILDLRACRKLREFSVTSENMTYLDISFTEVNALPSLFGRQNKLQILWLTNSGIESFPSSFMNLTRLRYLFVEKSTKLHTLTKLPPSLEVLDAADCTSLKTVLFPSIAEQFKENRRLVLFLNCFKLDEHSLKAIELNARINVMKLAYQHLSVPDGNPDKYNRSYGSSVLYVYPGSRVPQWLEYQTMKDYIIIDLSLAPRSSLLGFIFCFIISGRKRKTTIASSVTFRITISDGEDESEEDSIDMYHFTSSTLVWTASDHVCVFYEKGFPRYLNSTKNQNMLKIELKVMAAWGVGLKGFGVSPVNTSSYHNFVEHINPTAYHNFIQQINSSANSSFIEQMEVSNPMHFIPILSIILFISLWWLRCRL